MATRNECRSRRAACCIALSLSSAIPGMPAGKPADVPCAQLTVDLRCALYGRTERPAVCLSFQPMPEHCGSDREAALRLLGEMERVTR